MQSIIIVPVLLLRLRCVVGKTGSVPHPLYRLVLETKLTGVLREKAEPCQKQEPFQRSSSRAKDTVEQSCQSPSHP